MSSCPTILLLISRKKIFQESNLLIISVQDANAIFVFSKIFACICTHSEEAQAHHVLKAYMNHIKKKPGMDGDEWNQDGVKQIEAVQKMVEKPMCLSHR